MPKQISSKITALTFGILVICFAIAFYVVAWTEPTVAPPGGNVPAPLNVSGTAQVKEGNLTINGILKTFQDMIVNLVTIKGDGSMSPKLNADKLDDYNAADLMAGTGGAGSLVLWGAGADKEYAPSCPTGWTSVMTGYGPFLVGLIPDSYQASATYYGPLPICSTTRSYDVYRSGAFGVNLGAGSYGAFTQGICRVCVK